MNHLNCEYIRDVYPDVLHGKVDAATAADVRAHLAGCADCREEAALIEHVHAVSITAPIGLEQRILAHVSTRATSRTSRLRHLAFAATVAAAVIGGALLLDRGERPVQAASQGLGFVTVEDAMVSGTSSLQDLTIEELEQLLGELES